MDNDSLDILFFNKKKEVHFFSARAFSKNIHFFVRRISDGYKSFIIIKIDMMMMLYDMKLKRKNGRIIYIYQPRKSRYGKQDKDSLQ